MVPDEIAGYRIVRRLGEGGMGVVYLAEKTEPFVRTVALKVMRTQALTETARIRFQLEQEMLARLSHPHIAQIYEAGTADGGSPFFAMELVEGRRIARYCAEQELSRKKRLRLFLQVCAAVQFAHQRGVVHRDLKPSNIMVREDTREPMVKLIDFGIAKVSDQLQTGPDDRSYLGTPAYMAPESFLPERGVDTRSDVYSLGLVLQEILTDTNPLGGSVLDAPSATQECMLSSVEASMDDTTALLDQQEIIGKPVLLTGDLGAIIGKATATDRDDRYESVLGLAEDIRRHLDGRPVQARSDQVLYRFFKAVRRHRAAFAAAAVVLLAIGAGTVATALEARRANREARTSAELTRFMTELFEVADPSESRGQSITVKEVLDRGAERIQTGFDGPPELRARLALTMGVVYRSLGLYRDSRPLLDLAVGTFEETGPDSDPLADALVERGRLLTDMETDMELGREGFERALALKEALYGADSPEWATSALHAAVLLKRAGAFDETADLAASAARRLSFHPELQSDRAFALGLYGSIESRRGNHDTALDALKRALALSRNSEPQDLIVTATLLNDLSVAYSRASDQAAAISTTRALLAVDREIYGDEHPYVVSDLHNLAMMNYLAGNPQESLPLLIKVFELRVDSLGGENHPAIGEIYKDLGLVRLALNDVPAARDDIERGLAIITKELGTLHFRTAIVLSAVARLRRETGDLTGAIETMKQVRDIFAETLGSESPRVTKSEAFIAEVSSQLEQARRSP